MKKQWPSTQHYFARSSKEKYFYSAYWCAIIHAIVSSTLSIYGFIYADGTPNTTWFHCNYYKLHMFDMQLYANILSIGYLI